MFVDLHSLLDWALLVVVAHNQVNLAVVTLGRVLLWQVVFKVVSVSVNEGSVIGATAAGARYATHQQLLEHIPLDRQV